MEDSEADRLLERSPAGWFGRSRNAEAERRRKLARAEEQRQEELRRRRAETKKAKAKRADVVAEADPSATFSCCLLTNLFDRATELDVSGPQWATEIREDFAAQVAALQPLAVVVDDWTDKGRVLIRFPTETAARKCAEGLDGRGFNGRTIAAHVVSLSQAELVLASRSHDGGGGGGHSAAPAAAA
jgi:hypothetical protein